VDAGHTTYSVGMRRLVPLLLVAGALLPTAHAQQLYRCGNVYSQTPCAADAAPVRARSDAVADSAPGPRGAELCGATAMNAIHADADGPVQVGAVTKAPAEVIQYADKPTATRRYVVDLTVKGAYTGYVGPMRFACNLSEDERRVLKFGAVR